MMIDKAYEKKVLKIIQEIFGQLKNSLYFCTRKSGNGTTEQVRWDKSGRREIIENTITTKKVRKN